MLLLLWLWFESFGKTRSELASAGAKTGAGICGWEA